MKKYLALFVSFFKVGILTFGGGYAMLPMLRREVVERHGWVTDEELLDCYAIGQCTPGVIAVNTATFVGHKVKKTMGSLVATAFVVLPSLIIISIIALFLRHFADNVYVKYAFAGIRVAVAVLVVDAVIKLYKKGVKGALGNAVFAATAVICTLFSLSPVWFVLAAVVIGVILAIREGKKT
jgi:chromate transporter